MAVSRCARETLLAAVRELFHDKNVTALERCRAEPCIQGRHAGPEHAPACHSSPPAGRRYTV